MSQRAPRPRGVPAVRYPAAHDRAIGRPTHRGRHCLRDRPHDAWGCRRRDRGPSHIPERPRDGGCARSVPRGRHRAPRTRVRRQDPVGRATSRLPSQRPGHGRHARAWHGGALPRSHARPLAVVSGRFRRHGASGREHDERNGGHGDDRHRSTGDRLGDAAFVAPRRGDVPPGAPAGARTCTGDRNSPRTCSRPDRHWTGGPIGLWLARLEHRFT